MTRVRIPEGGMPPKRPVVRIEAVQGGASAAALPVLLQIKRARVVMLVALLDVPA